MSNTSSFRPGQLILRLLLCVLLTFSLLGTAGGIAGGFFLSGSSALLTSQLTKQNAAQKAYDSLKTKWETEYNTSAVPAEVYLEVITPDWLSKEMQLFAASAQSNVSGNKTAIGYIDFTALEDSITAYFEDYAAENSVEKDDTYTQKLSETMEDAESAVKNAVDVYHVQTMMDAGIWSKLQKLHTPLWIMGIGCGILSAVLILLLRPKRCYWVGCSLFADGILLTIPAAVILGSGVIGQFTLKEPAVYAVFTGVMTQLTQYVLAAGIVLLLAGLALLLTVLLPRRRAAN